MEKSENSNKGLILGSGILVAVYLSLQFSLYFYKPATSMVGELDATEMRMPREATLLNAAVTYMVSIIGIKKD